MKIEIDGVLPAVGSLPITEWEVYVDGEKQIIRSLESSGFREFAIEVEPLVKVIKKNLEEEKKMLNFDKYREEVEKRAAWAVREGSKNPKPAHLVLKEIIIGNCLPYMNGNELVDWLFEEFELPLLKNGYGLKPGDWIMVREHEHDSWDKMRFVCFADDLFYVIDDALGSEVFEENGTNITGWKQARLPEDGE